MSMLITAVPVTDDHAGHGQTCPLAARKHLDLFVDILAAEQERPEDIAHHPK